MACGPPGNLSLETGWPGIPGAEEVLLREPVRDADPATLARAQSRPLLVSVRTWQPRGHDVASFAPSNVIAALYRALR